MPSSETLFGIFAVLLIAVTLGSFALAERADTRNRERAVACAKLGGDLVRVGGKTVCGKVEVIIPHAGG